MDPLINAVRRLGLQAGDFAIFGSGPMIVRGIIPAGNDIDILCRGAAWTRMKTLGQLTYLEHYDVEVISMLDGRITAGTTWAIGEFDVDVLIDTAETIDGLPYVRLQHVVEYKRIRRSDKDLFHLQALVDRGILGGL